MSEPKDFEEEFARLQRKMNQLFIDFSRESEKPESLNEIGWVLPLDILEDKDDIIVRADVPGIKPNEIDLSISGDILRIKGERKRVVEREDENYHTIERGYGKFDRRVTLPTSVKVDSIKASCKDGMLTVRLPKTAEKKVGEIKVSLE